MDGWMDGGREGGGEGVSQGVGAGVGMEGAERKKKKKKRTAGYDGGQKRSNTNTPLSYGVSLGPVMMPLGPRIQLLVGATVYSHFGYAYMQFFPEGRHGECTAGYDGGQKRSNTKTPLSYGVSRGPEG